MEGVYNCSYPSPIPFTVNIVYGCLLVLIFFIVIFKAKKETESTVCVTKKLFGVYSTLITHFWDQASDISVIIQFIIYYINDIQCESRITKNNVNMRQYIGSTIFMFCFYRIMSSIWIYIISKNYRRLIIQLFDFEIYRAIWFATTLNITEASEPQKRLQNFEMIFEALPQSFVQITFVVVTGNIDFVFIFSIIFSLMLMILKAIDIDEILFKDMGCGYELKRATKNNDALVMTKSIIVDNKVNDKQINDDNLNDEKINSANDDNINDDKYSLLAHNVMYILRILFRVLNITSSILLYSLIWMYGYGYIVIIVIAFNIIIHTILFLKRNFKLVYLIY